jgi:hypothetical protein
VDDDIEEVANKLLIFRGKKTREATGQQTQVAKRKTKHLLPERIASSLVPCKCGERCFENFSFTEIQGLRKAYWGKKQAEQADWVARELALHGYVKKDGIFKFRYFLEDKECCAEFLERALPISHGRLSQLRERVLSKSLEDSSRSSATNCPKADAVEEFIRKYGATHSEGLPNKIDVDLPAGVTKEEVFIEYLLTFENAEASLAKSCKLSTWYRVWRERCFHIKCKRWNRFSKCTTCSNIKALRLVAEGKEQGERQLTHPGMTEPSILENRTSHPRMTSSTSSFVGFH